jgi:transposase
VKAAGALEKSQDVMAALDALRARLADDDRDAVEKAQGLIEEFKSLVATLDGQLAAMRWLAQKQFRPKTDKVAPGQLALDLLGFMLGQKGSPDAPSAPAADAESPAAPARTPRDKRKSNLHLLPVVSVDKELPEAERVCESCATVKTEFGFEPKRHLVYEPPKLFIHEERLRKYACRCCGNGVVIAPGTPKLIEGSNVSSSVLSHLVVSKVIDATPVERVGKQWARHGVEVASSTMHDWFGRSAEEVAFLSPIAKADTLRSLLVSFDDTPMPAKVAGHAHGTQRGRLWLYIGDLSRVAYCEFTPDWKGCHPQGVLADYRGSVQSDGYGGIAALFTGPDAPNKVGCNDHARRKFVEALKLGDQRAARVVALYGELYAVERDAKHLSPDERLRMRQARSMPLWATLTVEVARLEAHAEAKGPLGKAVTYFRRQNAALSAFLSNGILPISNAHVERLLRSVALFRKNSLFVGSLDAGKRYAALLTLAINCALCGANPFRYFTELFDRIAAGWPAARAAELMPQAWLAAQQKPEQVHADVVAGHPLIHD